MRGSYAAPSEGFVSGFGTLKFSKVKSPHHQVTYAHHESIFFHHFDQIANSLGHS